MNLSFEEKKKAAACLDSYHQLQGGGLKMYTLVSAKDCVERMDGYQSNVNLTDCCTDLVV